MMTAKCAYVIKRAEKKRVREKETDNAKKKMAPAK